MKLKEWFAVKRTKDSKTYQFYPPNVNNRKTIAAIAPDMGNYEVITLIDKSEYDELKQQRDELVQKLTVVEAKLSEFQGKE